MRCFLSETLSLLEGVLALGDLGCVVARGWLIGAERSASGMRECTIAFCQRRTLIKHRLLRRKAALPMLAEARHYSAGSQKAIVAGIARLPLFRCEPLRAIL